MRRHHALAAAVLTTFAPTTTASAAVIANPGPRAPRHAKPKRSPVSPALQAIAACESGGDPTAVDASGTYRGKYQFDRGTWASLGGSGDPAAAPEAEQDRRAAILMARSGTSPWPICGG